MLYFDLFHFETEIMKKRMVRNSNICCFFTVDINRLNTNFFRSVEASFLTEFPLVKESVEIPHLTVGTTSHSYIKVSNLDLRTGKIAFDAIKEEQKVPALIKAGTCTCNF